MDALLCHTRNARVTLISLSFFTHVNRPWRPFVTFSASQRSHKALSGQWRQADAACSAAARSAPSDITESAQKRTPHHPRRVSCRLEVVPPRSARLPPGATERDARVRGKRQQRPDGKRAAWAFPSRDQGQLRSGLHTGTLKSQLD